METKENRDKEKYTGVFKSYYVVWKRISRRYRSATHSFKSYYVVWKLIIKYLKLTENEGLNRTMQYGNKNRPF